jgi:hypothetical protein
MYLLDQQETCVFGAADSNEGDGKSDKGALVNES